MVKCEFFSKFSILCSKFSQKNQFDINIQNENGTTPLHFAIYNNDFKIVKLLVNTFENKIKDDFFNEYNLQQYLN